MELPAYSVVWKRLCIEADSAEEFSVQDASDRRRYVQVLWKGRVILEGPLEELLNIGFIRPTIGSDGSNPADATHC